METSVWYGTIALTDIRQSSSDRDECADRMVPERGLSLYWKRAADQYLGATCGLRAGGYCSWNDRQTMVGSNASVKCLKIRHTRLSAGRGAERGLSVYWCSTRVPRGAKSGLR